MLAAICKRQVAALLRRTLQPDTGVLVISENGSEQLRVGSGDEIGIIEVRDPSAYVAFVRGNIATGEAYMNGQWDSPDLAALLQIVARNLHGYNRTIESGVLKSLSVLGEALTWLVRRSRWRAKTNVARHYDLGNDMFAQFLDSELQYSCAVYPKDGSSLDEAQRHKLQLLCERAGLADGAQVLDLGCGWGGLSAWIARNYDAKVVALTLSEKQYAFVRQRIAQEGLADKVTPVLTDYRDYRPAHKFDRILSVEMIEAVGPHNFASYFAHIRDLLKPGGKAVIQAITVPKQRFSEALYDIDFVKKYIFPGGACPSRELLEELGAKVGLRKLAEHDITEHYVTTLRHWRDNFVAARKQISALGYGEGFCRMMYYYFAYCEVGFATRETEDVQVVYQLPGEPA